MWRSANLCWRPGFKQPTLISVQVGFAPLLAGQAVPLPFTKSHEAVSHAAHC